MPAGIATDQQAVTGDACRNRGLSDKIASRLKATAIDFPDPYYLARPLPVGGVKKPPVRAWLFNALRLEFLPLTPLHLQA